MLSQKDANACVKAAADDIMKSSYDELFELLKGQDDIRLDREVMLSGETFYLSTAIGKLGFWRKRICVEIVLSAKGGFKWPETPCVYFERFKSGRIYLGEVKPWEAILLKAFLFLSFVVAIISLITLGLKFF